MTDEEKLIQALKDFPTFAKNFLNIRTKSGRIEAFELNKSQLYIHERLEAQLKETGKVRAIILKGRQLGCSTLIQARFFHKVITQRGKKAFILTHEAEATKNLFAMTKRYYEGLPPGLAPKPDASSAKELNFTGLDSGYAVGTAGNKAVGRSQTIQLFHGSETGYWPHAEEHSKGIMQAISNEPGTEIIIESTANGIGNYFNQLWCSALTGDSEFQAIFVPWYWQREYTASYTSHKSESPPLSEQEQSLLDLYKEDGMTVEHLYWRRIKIKEFSSDWEEGEKRFKVEYPLSATEAFRNPVDDTFINSKHVTAARKADIQTDASLIIGVDPAIGENDRCAIIRRRGRKAFKIETLRNQNTMQLAGRIKRIIEEEKPHRVYIDCIGIGAGTTDRLSEMGYSQVVGVNVARSANDKERFANQRAEYYWELRDWLQQELDVQLPDSDELHADLCGFGYRHRSNGQLLIESKDDMKKRGMRSPDIADSLMLTFAGGKMQSLAENSATLIPERYNSMFT